MSKILYALKGINKVYRGPAEELQILSGIDLTIDAGDYIAIVGASGSGKSTLLHILGTLDTPSSGSITFGGCDLGELSEAKKAEFRNRQLGFVFQFHHLLPEFNTLENVAMQAMIGGMGRAAALELASAKLDLVGLGARKDHSVTTLSGGERQRAAIARAILCEPKVLLADEPTGNLDERTGGQISELLLELNRLGTTLVVVTHNLDLAAQAGRILELRGGQLVASGQAS